MIGQCLSGGLGWLEVVQSLQDAGEPPAGSIRRSRGQASLRCRSCRKGRSAPPVRMIKLTQTRRDHKWVHPHEER
jgi:hypothetical protein